MVRVDSKGCLTVRSADEFRQAAREYTSFSEQEISDLLNDVIHLQDGKPEWGSERFAVYGNGDALLLQKELTQRIGARAYRSVLLLAMNNKINGQPSVSRDFDHTKAIMASVDDLEKRLGNDREEVVFAAEDIYSGLLGLSRDQLEFSSAQLIVSGPKVYAEKGMGAFRDLVLLIRELGDHQGDALAETLPALLDQEDGSYEHIMGIARQSKLQRVYPQELVRAYIASRKKILEVGGEVALGKAVDHFLAISRSSKYGSGGGTYLRTVSTVLGAAGMEGADAYAKCFIASAKSTVSMSLAMDDFGPKLVNRLGRMRKKSSTHLVFGTIAGIIPVNWRLAGFLLEYSPKIIGKIGISGWEDFCKQYANAKRGACAKAAYSFECEPHWFYQTQPYMWYEHDMKMKRA